MGRPAFQRLSRQGDRRRSGPRRGRLGRHLLLNAIVAGAVIGGVAPSLLSASAGSPVGAGGAGRFGYCKWGGGANCVVDGDTFWIDGRKVRIADIDTPETHPPRCPEEARLGEAAALRLQALLNAGSVTLVPIGRGVDRYGRLLRRVEAGGTSVGDVLVGEGLVRPYGGGRRSWCGAA